MPSLNHTHASLCCNDFQFGYVPVPVPVPRARLSKQDGPDPGPVVCFVDLGEKLQIPTETAHLFTVVFRKKPQKTFLCIPYLLLCASEFVNE